MGSEEQPSAAPRVIFRARQGSPDLRILHYNDVYHVEAGSAEPVGGASRFKTLCDYYRDDERFAGQPKLITLFSGDAFNPSLESSVTKGAHMVPLLNSLGTDVACVGNHDLDFGVPQFEHLASQCAFPWLLANVLDPELGEDVPLGHAKKYVVVTSSNGIKVGILGLVEREWLDTINSLPPNLIYKSATATAKEIVPQLRKDGAEIIVALTHAREPNDIKLANNTNGLIDIVLGGHDHFYGHSIVKGTHLLRSGTDFKQLSYIEAWRSGPKWDFKITRRDVMREIPENSECNEIVREISSALKAKLEKPIGYTAAPLDARFTTVRVRESNFGNFICDLMRLYHQADCAIMASGTIRGDQVYPPGVLCLKDIMNCFPFEDPVVVLKIKGKGILQALENGVSQYPALEGRFPQVSNIHFHFDPRAPPMSRIKEASIGGYPIDLERDYTLATRGYMAKGKDGYHSLQSVSEGGAAEVVVSEENGLLISMILRQYFMSLKVIGRWKRWGDHMRQHWGDIQQHLHATHPVRQSAAPSPEIAAKRSAPSSPNTSKPTKMNPETNDAVTTMVNGDVGDSDSEDEDSEAVQLEPSQRPSTDRELLIMRWVMRKWQRLAGVERQASLGREEDGEFFVGWTKGIAPQLEGRITQVSHS